VRRPELAARTGITPALPADARPTKGDPAQPGLPFIKPWEPRPNGWVRIPCSSSPDAGSRLPLTLK
jgi:hypothetical protein